RNLPFQHRCVRPVRPGAGRAPRSRQDRGGVLLPAVQDAAGAHRGRRGRELLRARDVPPDVRHAISLPERGAGLMDRARLQSLLDAFPRHTVLVVGDFFLDKYLDIDAALSEPSLETGLEAYQVVGVRTYPGAAGTVANNLRALEVNVVALSVV